VDVGLAVYAQEGGGGESTAIVTFINEMDWFNSAGMMLNLWMPEAVPPELREALEDPTNLLPSQQHALRPLSWGYRLAERVLPKVVDVWLATRGVHEDVSYPEVRFF
jgi:hypothetical protein